MAMPPKYAVATVRYGVPTRQLQINVLWYAINIDPAGANQQEQAQTIANNIKDAIQAPLLAILTTETTFIGVSVALHDTGVVFDAVSGSGNAGTIAQDTLPEYCAVVIQKRTATAGKEGRGRWYVGCVSEDSADNGAIDPLVGLLYQALADSFVADLNDGVNNYGEAMHHSAKNDSLQPIISTGVNSQLGTQRRRIVRPLI